MSEENEDRYRDGRIKKAEADLYKEGRLPVPVINDDVPEGKAESIEKELAKLYRRENIRAFDIEAFVKAHEKEMHLEKDPMETRIFSITEGMAARKARLSRDYNYSLDGDWEDGDRECLMITGKLSYADRRRLKYMADDMRDLDRAIDAGQNTNDPELVKGALKRWEDVRGHMMAFLNEKNVLIKRVPKKNLTKEIKKTQEIERKKEQVRDINRDEDTLKRFKRDRKKERGMILERRMEQEE